VRLRDSQDVSAARLAELRTAAYKNATPHPLTHTPTPQVEGASGLSSLGAKVSKGGPTVLYHGALAASAATFVGHYPWFATYNTLDHYLPKPDADTTMAMKLLRSAFMGFWCARAACRVPLRGRRKVLLLLLPLAFLCPALSSRHPHLTTYPLHLPTPPARPPHHRSASLVSDTCSNSIRVVKTAKQTVTVPMTYPEVVKMIVEKDGLGGLFGRGLRTKILANAVQVRAGLVGRLVGVGWLVGGGVGTVGGWKQRFLFELEASRSGNSMQEQADDRQSNSTNHATPTNLHPPPNRASCSACCGVSGRT